MTDHLSQPEPRPALRIVAGGEPRDEEVAALVAVLGMRGGDDKRPAAASRWRAGGASASAWGRDSWTAAARRGALRPNR